MQCGCQVRTPRTTPDDTSSSRLGIHPVYAGNHAPEQDPQDLLSTVPCTDSSVDQDQDGIERGGCPQLQAPRETKMLAVPPPQSTTKHLASHCHTSNNAVGNHLHNPSGSCRETTLSSGAGMTSPSGRKPSKDAQRPHCPPAGDSIPPSLYFKDSHGYDCSPPHTKTAETNKA